MTSGIWQQEAVFITCSLIVPILNHERDLTNQLIQASCYDRRDTREQGGLAQVLSLPATAQDRVQVLFPGAFQSVTKYTTLGVVYSNSRIVLLAMFQTHVGSVWY